MRIVEARIYLVEVGGRRPILLQLATDDGVRGIGEAALAYGAGSTAAAGMIRDLAQKFLPGADPFRIEAIWSEMYDHSFWAKGGGPVVFAGMSAIEMALWDLKGKALGFPVYELLGGKCREDVRVYANGWSYRHNSPEEQAQAALRVVEDGYTALKMYPLATPTSGERDASLRHVSRRSIDRDLEDMAVARVRAVREAIGPKIDLMVDMSAELTPDAIIRVAHRMEDTGLLFFEEPVDPFDLDGLKKVSDRIDISIAVGERIYSRYGFRPILERRAADILQPDLGTAGGIMETKKIAVMAEAYDMLVAPHNCASPVCTAASLQLDACIANFLIQEVFPYRRPEHFELVDLPPEQEIKGGRLPIPDRPGLGVELVEELVAPFLWAECKL